MVTAPMRVKREIGPLGGGVGFEVDTLTIRISMRLQRRGGRKLMTPERAAAPARKPRRDETLVKALLRAHYWRRKI